MIETRNNQTDRSTQFGIESNEEEINLLSITNIEEERNIRNSQFKVQFENADIQPNFDAVPEQGALIYREGNAYYGNGDSFIQLANKSDVPINQSGYQLVADNQYSLISPLTFTASPFVITNNAGVNLQNNLICFRNNIINLERNRIFTISVSFTVQVHANNQHADLYFGNAVTGTIVNGYSDVLSFVKGNGVYHKFTRTFQIVGTEDTQNTGIKVYLSPTHGGSIFGAEFIVNRSI
jgi:hypothetical protein